MKFRLTLAFLFFFDTIPLAGQQLDIPFIKRYVYDADSSRYKRFDEAIYIIDGLAYPLGEFEKRLKNLDQNKDRISINLIEADRNGPYHPKRDYIIIVTSQTVQQSFVKKRQFRAISSRFKKLKFRTRHGGSNKSDPVLILNGSMMKPNEARFVLELVNLNHLHTVHFSEYGPKSLYGERAENGVAQLWFK